VFWAILLAAALIRLALAIELDGIRPVLDEDAYLRLADNLAREGSYTGAFRPPLYPAFMALHLALGWGTLGIRITQALLGTLTLVFVYRIGARTLGRAAARMAAALVACDPVLVMFSLQLWSETLFIFLLFAALDLLTADAAAGKRWPWLAAGLLLGLAGLARPMILTLVPLLLPWALVQLRRRQRAAADGTSPRVGRVWLGSIARFGLLALGCVAVVSPWTIRNACTAHALIIVDTNGPFNFLVGTQPQAAFVDKDDCWSPRFGAVDGRPYQVAVERGARDTQRRALQQGFENIKADPTRFLRKCLWEAGHLWTLDSFLLRHLRNGWYGATPPRGLTSAITVFGTLFFAALVLAGLFGLAAQPSSPFRGLALLMVLHATLLFGLTYSLSRYCLPLHPVLAVFAASALIRPLHTLSRVFVKSWRSPRPYVLIVLLLGIGVVWLRDWPLISDMLTTGGAGHTFHLGSLPPPH